MLESLDVVGIKVEPGLWYVVRYDSPTSDNKAPRVCKVLEIRETSKGPRLHCADFGQGGSVLVDALRAGREMADIVRQIGKHSQFNPDYVVGIRALGDLAHKARETNG